MDIQIGVGIFLGEQIEEELERRILNLQKRVLRDSSNPFDIPETLFKGLYHLPKRLAEENFEALENNQPNNEPEYGNLLALGRRTRNQLIRNYFQ